jgi:hypothetical protein
MKSKLVKIETKCRLCYKKKLHHLISLGNQPLANSLNNKMQIKELKFPLNLCMCKNCKTVQIKETINPKILFEKYFWQTATSFAAKKFSKIFCKKILSYLKCKKPFILEIASNDGTFLMPFKKNGLEVLGIDPDAKEAILFALLANEAVAGTPLFAGGHATKIPITMGKMSFPL